MRKSKLPRTQKALRAKSGRKDIARSRAAKSESDGELRQRLIQLQRERDALLEYKKNRQWATDRQNKKKELQIELANARQLGFTAQTFERAQHDSKSIREEEARVTKLVGAVKRYKDENACLKKRERTA